MNAVQFLQFFLLLLVFAGLTDPKFFSPGISILFLALQTVFFKNGFMVDNIAVGIFVLVLLKFRRQLLSKAGGNLKRLLLFKRLLKSIYHLSTLNVGLPPIFIFFIFSIDRVYQLAMPFVKSKEHLFSLFEHFADDRIRMFAFLFFLQAFFKLLLVFQPSLSFL